MVKRILAILAAAALVATPMVVKATQQDEHEAKTYVCHQNKDGQFEVKKVETVKSPDFAYTGPVDNHGKPTEGGAGYCANHQPGDKCANFDGKQAEVPAGDVVDGAGNCVAAPVTGPKGDQGNPGQNSVSPPLANGGVTTQGAGK